MESKNNSTVPKSKYMKDLIGVALLLVLGIPGMIFASNPVNLLFPINPLLSPGDWTGSQLERGSGIERHENGRFYELSLVLRPENSTTRYKAQIRQYARWYADAGEAEDRWNHASHYDPSDFIYERSIAPDHPASRLNCNEYQPTFPTLNQEPRISCDYEAYREHWYVQIFFSSESDETLSLSKILEISIKASQLLMMDSEH